MHMRTHVEVDPRVGLQGFRAVRELEARLRLGLDLQICVFPQEGLHQRSRAPRSCWWRPARRAPT